MLDELNRVDEIKGQRAANVLTSVKTRRKAVATALAGCPRGEWIAIDDLFATMRRNRETSPTVARSEHALWKLYLVDPQYGSLGYSGFADWPILEGRYTLTVLFEYAATLGLIDIEYTDPVGARTDHHGNWGADDLDYLSRYDGLRAIRLNPLGAYALGLTGDYQPPAGTTDPERTLKVLPTLDIVAVGDPTAADRLFRNTSSFPARRATATRPGQRGGGRAHREVLTRRRHCIQHRRGDLPPAPSAADDVGRPTCPVLRLPRRAPTCTCVRCPSVSPARPVAAGGSAVVNAQPEARSATAGEAGRTPAAPPGAGPRGDAEHA